MRWARPIALLVLVLTLVIVNYCAISALANFYSFGSISSWLPETFDAYDQARHEASMLFPLALLVNTTLVPLTIALLPNVKSDRGWMTASVLLAVLATALCWPSTMSGPMQTWGFMINGIVIAIPELEIAIVGCIAASIALFLKSPDWNPKLSLIELVIMGSLGAFVTIYVSIHSRRWQDLPWMGGGWAFIAHTFILFVGASATGWYIASGRKTPSIGVMTKRFAVNRWILLLIYTMVSFGLIASIFGYGLLTPQYVDIVREGSHSVLLNALPGTIMIALLFGLLRLVLSREMVRMATVATVVYFVMLAATYYTVMEKLAPMYGT